LIKLNDSSPVLSQRDYWWGIPAARQLLVAPSIYIDWIPIWIPIRIGLDYGRIWQHLFSLVDIRCQLTAKVFNCYHVPNIYFSIMHSLMLLAPKLPIAGTIFLVLYTLW